MGATRRAGPYQHPRPRPVKGAGHRMLHRVAFRRVRIEDMRAVREVIADYQVEMTVAIHIRLGRRVAEPPLLAGDNLLREEARWTQAAGPVRPAEETTGVRPQKYTSSSVCGPSVKLPGRQPIGAIVES